MAGENNTIDPLPTENSITTSTLVQYTGITSSPLTKDRVTIEGRAIAPGVFVPTDPKDVSTIT